MKNSLSLLRSLPADDANLRALVSRLIQDEHLVDDVLQETRIAAVEHHPRGRGQAPVAWLRRVAWNFALRRKRADARRRAHEQHAAVPDMTPSPDQILEREDARQAVVDAVRALDEPYRSVILYRYFENLPPREVAGRLDISVAAVKTRLTRALRQLRARLDGRFSGDRRAWQIALAPLAAGLPVAGSTAGAGTAATALTTLTGSLAMSLKAKLTATALAVVVFGTVTGIVLISSSGSSRKPGPALGSTANRADAAKPRIEPPAPRTAGIEAPSAPDRQARPGPAPASAPAALATAGSLSGTIHFDDEPPTPCEGAEVFVLQQQTGRWKQARAAPSGAYRIPELAPGVWKVLVRPVDYPEISDTHVQVNAGQDTVQDFVVQRGMVAQGRVVDSRSREGIAGASIVFQGRRVHTVTSGKDGAYVARGLDPVMLGRVNVSADGYQPTWERFTLDEEPVQSAHIVFQLRPLARIQGVVVDVAGVPVSGARVTTAFPHLFRQDRPGTTTDANGRFTILVSGDITPSHERPIALFAHRRGHAPGRTEPAYHAYGETVPDVTIRLKHAGSLVGSVVGDKAPGGSVVLLWPAGPGPARAFALRALREENQYRVNASDDGQFRIHDLAAGTYECVAIHESHGSPRQALEIVPGQTTRVRLELGLPEGAISGRVVDDRGQPVAGARIHVRAVRENHSKPLLVWRRLQSDNAGHFASNHLLDMNYFVQAHKRGFASDAQQTVRPGPNPVVIRLHRLPLIHGVVVDPDGAPARRFHLTIYRDRADVHVTARTTRRTVKDAPGGAFQFHVQSSDRAERYWIQARTDEGLVSPRVPVEVIPGQEPSPLRVQLTAGASLHGLVRDREGRPAASASVQLQTETVRDQRFTSTTLTGRFHYTGLTPGTYEIRAVHHEQGAAVKSVRIASPGEHDLTLILDTAGSTIRLVVQTAEGRPVVGARVYRCEPVKSRHQTAFERQKRAEPKLTWDDYRQRLVHTDPDGRWEGCFLPPRTYHLLVRAEGFRDHEIKIDLGPEQEIHRTVVLEREPNHAR